MSKRTNHPDHPPVIDKVRQWQRRLWVAAKRSPERRVHALMDRIWRRDVLREAWRRVTRNRGAAGVDGETLAAVECDGVERMLTSSTSHYGLARIGRRRYGGDTFPKPMAARGPSAFRRSETE